MRRDTDPEFKERLKKDLGLPDDDFGEAVVIAVSHCVWEGFAEMEPVYKRYVDLMCPWDGLLHRDSECDRKSAEFDVAHKAKVGVSDES